VYSFKTIRTIDDKLVKFQSLYKISPTRNIGEMILQLIADKGNVEKCLLEIKLRIEDIQENDNLCNFVQV